MSINTKKSASLEWHRHILIATFALSAWTTNNNAPSSLHAHAFSHPATLHTPMKQWTRPALSKLYAENEPESSPDTDNESSSLPSPNDMRLREIQSELKEKNISYADCFDKESLAKRLIEARAGLVAPTAPPVCPPEKTKEPTTTPTETAPVDVDVVTTTTTTEAEEFDKESTLIELRSLRVKELKEKLSGFKVRWGTMIEKEEMVQALCKAMKERFELSKNFSRSGSLIPGTVVDVEESMLIQELGWLESDVNRGVATTASQGADGDAPHVPILLDVYATWCGPCQFVAPLLIEAAEELGPTVRVVKLDSDKYPRISSLLKVGGLPTLIRFDGGDVSKEVQRVEGALTKDQMIDFVNGDFKR